MKTKASAIVQQFDSLSSSVLLGITDAIAVSSRSRSSIYRHFKSGELTPVKVGGSTRIRVGDLRKLIGGSVEVSS